MPAAPAARQHQCTPSEPHQHQCAVGAASGHPDSATSCIDANDQPALWCVNMYFWVFICVCFYVQAQAEVLTTRFGVSAKVVSVLRQVWLSHLPTTGMLEPTPHQPPAAALAAATAGMGQDGTEADADDMDAVDGDDDETEAGQLQRSAVLVLPKNMKHLFWKVWRSRGRGSCSA